MPEEVLLERTGAIAEIILNRPDRKNAVTGPLADGIRSAIEAAGADATIKAIILRGSRGAFCSGLDLKEFNADPRPAWLADFQGSWRSVHEALFACDKSVVCALEGFAINAGAALALGCDFVVAGESSFLQVGEVKQGRPAPMNMAWLRIRHGDALARRIVLLGDRIGAPELLRMGIVSRVVRDSEVLVASRALAADLAGSPAEGISAAKQIMRKLAPQPDGGSWFGVAASAAAEAGRARGPIPSLKP